MRNPFIPAAVRPPRKPLPLLSIAVLVAACSAPRAGLAVSRSGRAAHPKHLAARTLIIAHRGGALEAPENTIQAFDHARRAGADGIETDLRITRDGRIILYHDARTGRIELGRTEIIPDLSGLIQEFSDQDQGAPDSCAGLAALILTGIQKFAGPATSPLISDVTYSQLHTLRAGSDRPRAHTTREPARGRVPLLDDALASLPSGLIDLDIKPGPGINELLQQLIADLRDFRGLDRVVVEPPDLHSAQALRSALGPKLKIQITPGVWLAQPFEESLRNALLFKPHSISVPYSLVSSELVDRAHREGVEVWVWTVDSPGLARSLEAMGVDAIKTDKPAALMAGIARGR